MTDQLDIFGGAAPAPVDAAPVDAEIARVAAALSRKIYLGTSSWYFPGWAGIVWDRKASKQTVTRFGLSPYSAHPLLRTVSVDRNFYKPMTSRQFEKYAEQVGDDFRFLVKAPRECLTPLLSAKAASEKFIEPCLEGLGDKAGPLLFQFSPPGRKITQAPKNFIARLHKFLSELPKGPLYAVELRDKELLTPEYFDVLQATNARHCLSIHPRMPDAATQAGLMAQTSEGPLVVRWNLQAGFNYEQARARYEPFDKLVDEDVVTRRALAELCKEYSDSGRPVFLIANNKAEGSAPLSLIELAKLIAA
ncbi:MAG: DUF72 domain-containing protein [Gammaproteobacteria bacterium]|nr:DUF72 domain-containing protein [Gammaproteobacteria bacterium]